MPAPTVLRPGLSYLLLLLLAWTVLALSVAATYKFGLVQLSGEGWAPLGVSILILASGFPRVAKGLHLKLWEAAIAAVATIGIFAFVSFWIELLVGCTVGSDCL